MRTAAAGAGDADVRRLAGRMEQRAPAVAGLPRSAHGRGLVEQGVASHHFRRSGSNRQRLLAARQLHAVRVSHRGRDDHAGRRLCPALVAALPVRRLGGRQATCRWCRWLTTCIRRSASLITPLWRRERQRLQCRFAPCLSLLLLSPTAFRAPPPRSSLLRSFSSLARYRVAHGDMRRRCYQRSCDIT